MENRQSVSLGCGLLILIALVVLIFTDLGRGELRAIDPTAPEMDMVIERLERQEERIDELSARVDALTSAVVQRELPEPQPQLPPGEQP